ncbi:MAG TPA: DNRLRE domain-containing protein, partial [Ruminiclostridium sp.]|nr:DNRLRE domain-containing protein [Ruminiclostridium sp.]
MKFVKITSCTLVAALLFQTFSISAFGTEKTDSNSVQPSLPSPQTVNSEQKPYIIGEETGKREINSKTFRLSDGTFEVAQYDYPIHYKDNSGSWQNIDNSVTENTDASVTDDDADKSSSDSSSTSSGTSGIDASSQTNSASSADSLQSSGSSKNTTGSASNADSSSKIDSASASSSSSVINRVASALFSSQNKTSSDSENTSVNSDSISASADNQISSDIKSGYENKNNSFKVKFSNNTKGSALVRVKDGAYKLSWGLEDSKKSKSKNIALKNDVNVNSSPNSKTAANESQFTELKNIGTNCVYSDILPNVDLQYTLISQNLKENIILKNNKAQTDFNFKYKLSKLDMRYAGDGSIEVYDPKSSEVKFCIPKPVMTDASGVFSENVKLSFKKSGSTFHVTLSADKSWINDPARKFPVTVDPQIETPLVREQIHETFVSSNNGNTNYTSDGSLRVGNDNGPYGICRTYIKFDLPALSKTARVTSAYLNLYQYECDPSNLSGYEIDAHREAGYFDTANLKWCTQQDYSGVADYCMIDGAGGWRSWNVTNLVSDWYTSGNNSGVVLTANDESQHYNALFYSSDCPNLSNDGFPSVVFHYTDTQGLEDYWSTHTQDAGRAGTGYFNDYTGNVTVVENDIDESGSRLPLSLNHVFNNSAAIDGSYSSQTIKYGKGWKLDATERVFSSSIENYPYYLVDGDGTTHYFYKDPNNSSAGIVDEDGLGLTLTVLNSSGNTNSAIQIKDKDGNIEIFDSWSYLRVKKDSNGNAIKYNYSPIPGVDNYLSSITDGSGRTTGLQYNDNHVLTGITDPSGRQTAFGYDDPATGAHLTSITYPDGKKVLYTYDNDKISSMTNIDGYKITYTSYDGSNRCTGITETGSNGTAGNAMSIQYPCYNSTRFTDTVKNFSETYQFDNSGRTVSIVDDKQSASMYSYKSNTDGTVSKQNNKIASSAQTTQPVYNLIDNPGWENSSDVWQQGNLGNISNYGVTRQSSGGYKSQKCIMVTKGDAQSTAGAYEYFEYLSPGTYTFSTYVKTVDVADKGTDSGAGAVVAIYRSGILDRTVKSQLIKGTSDTSIDDGWQRVSVTFELKSGDTCINVFGAITNTTGTAYFDDFQLETGPVANLYNMLDNGSFDKFAVSGAAPSKWGATYSSGDGCSNIHYINGGWALQLNGGYCKKYVGQSVNVSGKEGDDFILGGWAKADSVPLVNTTREFGLNAAIIYTDGTVQWRTISFNDSVSDWQYASGVISTRYDDSSSDPNHNKTISRIDIYVDYSYNKNTAYFDGIQFYQDNGESYSYDDKGNLVSDKDKAAESSKFDYDSNNNLIKATDPNGASFTYAYDGNHNVTRARNTGDVKYSFKYDSYGNPVKSSTEGREQVSSVKSGGVYYIRSSVSNQYLDVSGFTDADGTAIMQHPFNGGFNQQFRLIDAGSGHYKIQPTNCTGRVIDINNGSAADGTKVEIWQSNGGSSQTFGISPNKDGTFSITTGCSNYASCIDTTNTLQDTAAVENKISSSGTQHFVFEQASDTPADVAAATSVDTSKEYFIKSWGTNDWLGIKNEGSSANSNVVHSTLTGREYQRWRIVDNGNGYYRILCDNSNLAVSVPSDQNSDNVALLLNNDTGSSGQQWSISYLGGYQFKITSACSSGTKGFDSQGSEYENLAQNTFTDATTQLWVLMPINETNDKIESTAAYTSDGNYMSSLTDARGNTVSYDYSHDAAGNTLSASEYNKGLLRSQTDAKGNKTNFSYDAATDSLNSVSATVDGKTVTNSYGYTNDDLTSITHNGFNYGFAYDEYGNAQKVNVGSQNLITNTYEGKNGNLLS